MQTVHHQTVTVIPVVVGQLRGWPTEKIDALAALIAEGLSYGLAADRLGVSRNSTLGLAHRRRAAGDLRFGLQREPVVRKPTGTKAEARKPARSRPVPSVPDAVRMRGLPLFCQPSRWQVRMPEPLNLSITEVRDRQCRHMGGSFDDFRCCGAPTDGGPWCDAHRKMLYAGTERRR